MSHVVLLGDSIFDNASYVPGSPPVVEQLKRHLPAGFRATLLAVDGDCIRHIPEQLQRLPADATHLIVSVGGNDALVESGMLHEPAQSVVEVLDRLTEAQRSFHQDYQRMCRAVLAKGKPVAVCTIYDSIPGLEPAARGALAVFNDCIIREAFRAGIPLIDLRLTCDQPADYSAISPLEPSAQGGEKIARAIASTVTRHDFTNPRTTVYA